MQGRKRSQRDKGSFIVLLAMLILVVIGFLALSIDTTLLSSSRAHSQMSADMAVMGALQTYGNDLTSSNPLQQANALPDAVANATLQLGNSFLQDNPGHFFQRVMGTAQSSIGICGAGVFANGCLRPINFYFPQPVGATCPANATSLPSNDPNWRPCSCDQSCECADGCPNDPLLPGQPAGNGMRLEYNIDNSSPLRGLFQTIASVASGGAPQEVHYGFSSRAVLTPRNAIFLLDLSDSMTSQTPYYVTNTPSLPALPASCHRRQYEYGIDPGLSCNTNGTTIHGLPHGSAGWNSSPQHDYQFCVYGGAPDWAGGPAGLPLNTVGTHRCIQFDPLTVPVTIQGTPATTVYDKMIVDFDPVSVPQPLTSALSGINQAMIKFLNQRVPRDRIGIVGFDHERILNRILAINTASDATMQPSLIDPTLAIFNDFKIATTNGGFPLGQPGPLASNWQQYLFPRKFDSLGNYGKVYSDLPDAAILAREMIFNTPDYAAAQNLVVMFSDGLANCVGATDPQPYAGHRCNDGTPGSTTPGPTYDYVPLSLPLLENEIATNYVPNKITFDMFLLDSGTLPHEMMWNVNGRCATQDEARGMGLPDVDITGSPDYIVNRLYSSISATGGIWAPLRPVSPVPINPNALNADCALINNNAVLTAVTGSGATVANGVISNSAPGIWPASGYWDSHGRMTYDPTNRTLATQVSDGMNQILAKPPYVLTTPSCRYLGDNANPFTANLPICP